MPSIKEVHPQTPSPSPSIKSLRDKWASAKLKLFVVHTFLQALTSDPKYMSSIHAAVEADGKYKPLYVEYTRTGAVPAICKENEDFSLMRYRSRTGGPAGPTMEGDYNDKHVYVCSAGRTLTVHHWLFMHPTLVIDLDQIVRLRPASDEVAESGVEAWGIGLTGVAWARDAVRTDDGGEAYAHSYVCEFRAEGEEFCAGFTVENPERFLRVMESLVPHIRAGCSKTRWVR